MSNASILVVEDEPSIQELIAFSCSSNGYRVRRAESAGAAESAIRSELPDLVILDWMLPDRPGIELLRDLRVADRTRSVPVIMLTAKGAESDRVTGLAISTVAWVETRSLPLPVLTPSSSSIPFVKLRRCQSLHPIALDHIA